MRSGSKFYILPVILLFLSGLLSGQGINEFSNKHFGKVSNEVAIDSIIKLSKEYAEENPDTAIFLAQLVYDFGKREKKLNIISRASYRLAEAWFYKDDYLKSIDYYRESGEAEFKQHGDSTFFFAERLSDEAYCYQELGIHDKALELYKASLRIQQKLGKNEEISNNYSNIGTSYFYRSEYDHAVEYYKKALEMDRQRNDSASIAISLNNIGMVYSRWGKHLQALEFYTESMKYITEEAPRAVKLSNIGMTWYHLKDYDKALGYLYQALAIDTKYKLKVKVGIRKTEIATVLAAKGDFRNAIQLHQEALNIFKETGVRNSQTITLADMGDLYRKTGDIDQAVSCYLESIAIAKSGNSLNQQGRNYRNLFEISESRGDFKKAIEYFKLYTKVQDSVFSIEKHEQIARFEVLFETEKKEKENQLLLMDLEVKQKKQRLAIAVISGLSVILILLYLLYRIKSKNLRQNQLLLTQEQELARMEIERKEAEKKILEDRIFAEKQINRLQQEKHKAEIEHKNTELANSTLCLVNKNEILGEIRDKLKDTQKTESINEVVRFINANTDMDQDWHKFKITFDDVHPGFFDRLQQEYNHLTENDLKISAYLRVSLSSREISRLMSVSLEAVNKSRQRLRKKLNLEPEADLNEFLKSV